MNRINEIGDTVRGQEMLGRTAERAHQRAQRTSGADKQRHEKTEWDAYQTAAGNSRKHLDGSGAHFARGRDAEYDEHWDDGRYPWSKKHKSKNESRNMNKKLIRLTESDLHRIVKESVEKILSESEYDNFFDWADNSSASPEEIEAASQRHDSRIPSIKSPTDKLARKERVFNRRASMNDPDIGERIANRKDFIKNQRQGERFRNRITR